MSWYQPLLDKYQNHLYEHHIDQGEYYLNQEYNMMEEFLLYEKFRHAQNEYICCDFCNWRLNYTVNFDLLTRVAVE